MTRSVGAGPIGAPGARRRRGTFGAARWRAAALVTATLAMLSPWTYPNAADGFLVLRTAQSLAFEGTFVLPPASPGTQLHPWFFRPAPRGVPGIVSVYQPLGSAWRAAVLVASSAVPAGRFRGLVTDGLLVLGPILITAACVFPLSRLLRYGGLRPRGASWAAAALLLGTFLGPLGSTDFSESLLVLGLLLSLETGLRARRARSGAGRATALAGFLAAATNLVKPVALAVLPAMAIPALAPRRGGSRGRLLAPLAAGAAAGLALVLLLNVLRTGSALDLGYTDQPLKDTIFPGWTLLRLTLLPNRGLFWLAPLSLLAFPGLALLLRSRARRADGLAALLGFGAFFSVNVGYWAWESGMGWSPRYLAPALVLLAPALGAGVRAFPRTAAALCLAGFLLNLPGYLVDPARIYRVVAGERYAVAPLGPFVPLHGEPGRPNVLHPLQRPHYVPSAAGVFVGATILRHLLLDGDGPEAGAFPSRQRKDALVLRAWLGDPLLAGESRIGRLLFEEADQTASVDPERGLRFALRSIDWGGPAVDGRAVGSYLAIVTNRPALAARLAGEGLALEPGRRDLLANLAAARARLAGSSPSSP